MRNTIQLNKLKLACAIAGVNYATKNDAEFEALGMTAEDKFFATASVQEARYFLENSVQAASSIDKLKAIGRKIRDFVNRHTLLKIVANVFLYTALMGMMTTAIMLMMSMPAAVVGGPTLGLFIALGALLSTILGKCVAYLIHRLHNTKTTREKAQGAMKRLNKAKEMQAKVKELDAKAKQAKQENA